MRHERIWGSLSSRYTNFLIIFLIIIKAVNKTNATNSTVLTIITVPVFKSTSHNHSNKTNALFVGNYQHYENSILQLQLVMHKKSKCQSH